MKIGYWKAGVVLVTFLMGLSLSIPAVRAEEELLLLQSGTKLARGVTNLATGWLELPKQIYEVGEEEGWLVGVLRGPIDGAGMSFARTVAGLYEVLTFPLPTPLRYQPLLQPAYVWERDLVAEPARSASILTPAK